MTRRRVVLPLAVMCWCLMGRFAEAQVDDLRELASRVETAWKAAGGTVVRRDSRFVMEDETTTLDLRGDALAKPGTCRRVALLGARGLSFHVSSAAGALDDALPVASAAGVLELQGCGSVPEWVKLKSDSGRGALEIVIGTAAAPLPPASGVLLERTGGVLPSPPEPGPLPPLPPVATRVSASKTRFARDGFDALPDAAWTASEDGKGGGLVTLDPGCHRFELFAIEPRGRARDSGRHTHLDLDGSIRREGRELIAEDQSIAADVRLEACVGASTKATVGFEGAPRGGAVTATHGYRALPAHLPSLWAPEMRARAATALLDHRIGPLSADAVHLSRGPAGATPLSIEVEPGACYLAIGVTERGRGLSLRATVGERVSQDERGTKDGGAAVAFCTREAKRARLDLDVRSSASGWSLAVYRVVGGVWGAEP